MDWLQDKAKYCLTITVTLLFLGTAELFAQHQSLKNLSDFEPPSGNWYSTDNISANPFTDEVTLESNGSGILVGSASSRLDESSLITKMEHGDLFLEFDVMLTRGASATVWLQGRYGLRLVDNWGSRKMSRSQNGSLVPPNTRGVESIGYGALQQIGRAPGLWQHLKIMFQGPQFNRNGEKVRDATFLFVEQNRVKIQESQTLRGPSMGAMSTSEVSEGPLEFRINNGTVAFKNIKYTASSGQKIQVESLSYKLHVKTFLDEDYFYGDGRLGPIELPDLDSDEPTHAGTIDRIHTGMTRGIGEDFALMFEGELDIPRSGQYRFISDFNGKGAFWLAGEERFRWDAVHKKGTQERTLELKEGRYSFKLLNVNFGKPQAELFVDGPGIIKQPLHQLAEIPEGSSVRPIILEPATEPLIQRSFVFFENRKLLNSINVGYPEGVHYTYNLDTGGLLRVWRGAFGDVTPMWHGRGLPQVLEPLGSVIPLASEHQLVFDGMGDRVPGHTGFNLIGYDLNRLGEPVFQYRMGGITVRDHLTLGTHGRTLTRTLQFAKQGEWSNSAWYRLAKGSTIERISDQLYAVEDKSFFIKVDRNLETEVRQDGEDKVLLIPLNNDGTEPVSISYSLIW